MNKRVFVAVMIAQVFSTSLFCQILQNMPSLCGSESFQPVPSGLVAEVAQGSGDATLSFGAGRKVVLKNANEIRQVCPIAANKLVVFGFNSVGYDVYIVDLTRGEVADAFLAYDPLMSPDQHWIAYRNFYPPQSQIPISNEYLLYDLNLSASANRHNPDQASDAGWAMYPAFPDHAPADLLDIPDANRHDWLAKSFFWTADSQAVFFADGVGEQVSLVLVMLRNDKPEAYVYPLSSKEICSGTGLTAYLNDASITRSGAGALNIIATFGESGCHVTLSSSDFRHARVEAYQHRKLKKSRRIKEDQ